MNASLTVLAPFLTAALAAAQGEIVFSIDWRSPTIASLDALGGVPVTEGDLLTPAFGGAVFGLQPSPGIAMSAGAGGLGLAQHAACVGHSPMSACGVEVDAVSDGLDRALPQAALLPGQLWFSTDEFARGFDPPVLPNAASEGPLGDLAADMLVNLGALPPGPLPPFAAWVGHTGALDGDGIASPSGAHYPGLGLIESGVPVPGSGDNIDAFDLRSAPTAGAAPAAVYFSLDGADADPLTGLTHSGSAAAHGFSPGDVLCTPPGGMPTLYAPAPLLGLDLTPLGPDDLDVLILAENGLPGYQPSQLPYDWMGGPAFPSDMLLFSVRRGSPIVGQPDSVFGVPIEPGDLLTTPMPFASGGLSPFPGIFIAAENLGLATVRTHGIAFGDDMTAGDSNDEPYADCNMNGVEDSVDIATGSSSDDNLNGIPDECEQVGIAYCPCTASAPCGNTDASSGCLNSTGAGAQLGAFNSASVADDDLVLSISNVPANEFGIFYMGPNQISGLPFGDGQRCVGGAVQRFPITNSGSSGVLMLGPGIVGFTHSNFAPAGQISAAQTWNFQGWFRDPLGPCGSSFNLSNALEVSFTP